LVLLDRQLGGRAPWEANDADFEAVRQRCIFTTHTPVPAGHDKFPESQVARSLGEHFSALLSATKCCDEDGSLNMTYLALRLSRYINGVAMRHREVSREMFPAHPIDSITNGVHAVTWTSEPFRRLFDRRIPEWRRDNLYLRYAVAIPLEDIRHVRAAPRRTSAPTSSSPTSIACAPSSAPPGRCRSSTAARRIRATRAAKRSSATSSRPRTNSRARSAWYTWRTTTSTSRASSRRASISGSTIRANRSKHPAPAE